MNNKHLTGNDEGYRRLKEACLMCEKDFLDGIDVDCSEMFQTSKRFERRMKRIIKNAGSRAKGSRSVNTVLRRAAVIAFVVLALTGAMFLIKPIRESVAAFMSEMSDNISHPERKEFSGFTVVDKKIAPDDLDGIDASFAPEASPDYDIYTCIGKIAVISRELGVYHEYASEALSKEYEDSLRFDLYVFDQSVEKVNDLRFDILSLISSFKVDEYDDTDPIEEKFKGEYELKKGSLLPDGGERVWTEIRINDLNWAQCMATGEIKNLISLCGDLLSQKSNGVEYGGTTSALIRDIKEKAEALSAFWDDCCEKIVDPDYPYPYRIERELFDDHMMLYIYDDGSVEAGTMADVLADDFRTVDRPDFLSNLFDCVRTVYNGEAKRYELFLGYTADDATVIYIRNTTTGLTRYYSIYDQNRLEGMVETGPYNEKEILDNMPSEIYEALKSCFGKNVSLLQLREIETISIISAEEGGVKEIGLETYTDKFKAVFGDGEGGAQLNYADIADLVMFSKSVYARDGLHYWPVTLNIDCGSITFTGAEFEEMSRYAKVNIRGCAEFLERYREEIRKAGKITLDDCYLKYRAETEGYFELYYDGVDGRPINLHLRFDTDLNLIE